MVDIVASGVRLTPHQVGALRFQIARRIEQGMSDVRGVLDGTKKWDTQQVDLFIKLLGKVVPNISEAFHERLHRDDAPRIESASRADLERMLAEALGEAVEEEPKTAAPDLGAAPGREYMEEYERRHPELKQRRAAANVRRYANKKRLGERIKARKASEPPEGPWTRKQDDGARLRMQHQVAKERLREAQRQMRRALDKAVGQDSHASRRVSGKDNASTASLSWRGNWRSLVV